MKIGGDVDPGISLVRYRVGSGFGRAVAFFVIGLVVAMLAWATVGRVDVVATAYGRVVPSIRSSAVQSVIDGTIERIHVRESSEVEAGDIVIVLDDTNARERVEKLVSQLARTRLERARLAALLSEDPGSQFNIPVGTDADQAELYRELLVEESLWQRGKVEMVDREILRIQEVIGAIDAERVRDSRLIPFMKERVLASASMMSAGHVPRLPHRELEEQLVRLEGGIAVYERRIGKWKKEIDRLGAVRKVEVRGFRSEVGAKLVELTGRIGDLKRDAVVAKGLLDDHVIRSPIGGLVQEVAPSSRKEYVRAGQVLMLVVPTRSELEVEARISNRDIGFVEVGQEASIKFEAFPFTRYGNVKGELRTLSRDVVKSGVPAAVNVTTDVNERKALAEFVSTLPGTNYLARFSIDDPWLETNGRKVRIEPGMTATVDIRVASRRVIDFLVSPLVRYSDESFRER